MDINDLTIGQAKELASMFGRSSGETSACAVGHHAPRSVLVCTDKRGVVFGETTNHAARPIVLTSARMCLYWSADVGGVFGLADIGPTKGCKISAGVPSITLEGVTAVFEVTDAARKAWVNASVQGR